MANNSKPAKRIDEFDLIDRYFAPLAIEGAFGLKDDAALISAPPSLQWVITQDTLVESVHFFADDPPDIIAQKAIRVNLSDIIAKGADPKYYSLSLALPDNVTEEIVAQFADGLARDQDQYAIRLTGGDTVKSKSGLHISVTMLGEIPPNCYVNRKGARACDMLVVSGTIGDAQLGLEKRLADERDADAETKIFVERQMLPKPPFGIQPIIRKFATASMDISDGLIGDLRKLCEASQISARVILENVPLSDAAQIHLQKYSKSRQHELLNSMVSGGDDYQCLFTIDPDNWPDASKLAQDLGIQLTPIGDIGAQGNCLLEILSHGVSISLDVESYSHFRQSAGCK